MLAWHFTGSKLRDGRPLPAIGETLVHTGEIIPCKSGYHASERLIDALQHAPGPHLWRVRLGGMIIPHDGDKVVAAERTGLWCLDATDLLRQFARQCALDVGHLWDMPAVVREYLETGQEGIRDAAKVAAWAAASAAAWAARDAAWAAASAAQNTRLTDMVMTEAKLLGYEEE